MASARTLRILIVEDILSDVELAARELQKEDVPYLFKHVDTRDDYLRALDEFQPDIVISDYSLPTFDGMQAIQLVKLKYPSIPVIILTGSMNEETAVQCMKAGAWDYVIKEHIKRLPFAIREALERKRVIEEKKAAESALRESEALFKSLIDTMLDAVVILDWDGTILFANQAAARMAGVDSEEQLIGTSILEFVPDESRNKILVGLGRVKEGKGGTLDDYRVVFPDGREAWVEALGTKISFKGKDADLVTLRDITASRQTQAELTRERDLLQSLMDNIPDTIYFKDTQSRFTRINNAQARLLGVNSPEEAIGKTDFDFFDAEFAAKTFEDEKRLIQDGEPIVNKIEQVRTTDGVRWKAATKVPLRDTNGRIVGLVGISRDVTEIVRAEESLRASEERYRKFFEDDLTADCITTPEGNLIDCNPAFVRMFGFQSREEALTYNVINLYYDKTQRSDILSRLHKTGKIENVEMHLKDIRGKSVYTIANILGDFSERGELISIKSYLFDITDRKHLEQQFMQAQKLESVGNLAGGVAHDMNNVLGAIIGHADLARRKVTQEHPLYERLSKITSLAERGARITEQLLAFSRRQQIEPKYLNLNTITNDLLKLLGKTLGEHIQIQFYPDPELKSVYVDPIQMDQVLMNLCINARDAMPEGGTLTIRTRNVHQKDKLRYSRLIAEQDVYVVLEVSDTGIGMSPEIMNRIFDPFFTTKAPGKGTGLGLSVVHGIVSQNKGFIDVESEPNKGTTFSLYLPAVDVPPEKVYTRVGTDTPRGTGTILIMEDDEDILKMVVSLLEEQGYTVYTAADGEEGIALYKKHGESIDLIISDVVMPKVTGRGVYEFVSAERPDMKFLFMSGYTDDMILKNFIREKKLQYIPKPFHFSEFVRKVYEVLNER